MLIKNYKKKKKPLHPICETDNEEGKRRRRAAKSDETQVVAFCVGVGFGLSILLHNWIQL